MKKPRKLNNKRFNAEAYESGKHKHVEVSIPKGDDLTPKQLRVLANWMIETASWMDGKSEKTISMDEFKEIVTNPMRVLFEALRYEEDLDIQRELVSEIEEAVCADMKADEFTELKIFEYLGHVNEDGYQHWREDFINEMIDRVDNPEPENNEIKARRLLYDYLNLEDDDTGILEEAVELLPKKSDKKMVQGYLDMWYDDEKPDCDGLGSIVHNLYQKYPLKVK